MVYVCGARPLKFREHTLTEGVEVPGAADWTRIEAWVNARAIRKIPADQPYTSYEEFTGMTLEDEDAAREVARLEEEMAAEQDEPQEPAEPKE